MPADDAPPPARWLTAEEATTQPRRLAPDALRLCQPQPDRRDRRAGRSAAQPLRRGRCAPARRTQPQRTQPSRRRCLDDKLGRADPRLRHHPHRGRPSRIPRPGCDRALRHRHAGAGRRAAVAGGCPAAVSITPGGKAWPRARAAAGVAERCIAAMAELAMAGRWAGRVESVLPDAVRILDRMAWAAAGAARLRRSSHRRCRCTSGWRRPGAPGRRRPT